METGVYKVEIFVNDPENVPEIIREFVDAFANDFSHMVRGVVGSGAPELHYCMGPVYWPRQVKHLAAAACNVKVTMDRGAYNPCFDKLDHAAHDWVRTYRQAKNIDGIRISLCLGDLAPMTLASA